MFYVRFRLISMLFLGLLLSACNEDLNPSSEDKRESVQAGSIGNQVNQVASDFSILDTEDNVLTLSDELTAYDAVVLYFTMWCPLCDSHMSSIRESIKPNYPNIHFISIDYVSGSTEQARANQISSGYRSETVVADTAHNLTEQFKGDMGVTVVINSGGLILMNEGFKHAKLTEALELASQP